MLQYRENNTRMLFLLLNNEKTSSEESRRQEKQQQWGEDFALFHRSFRRHAGMVHQDGIVWGSLLGHCWRR